MNTGNAVRVARTADHELTGRTAWVADLHASKTRKTCAIVEAYNRHDEVYLTTAFLLKRLGYDVHVFNAWRSRIKNAFVHAPNARPKVSSAFRTSDVIALVEQQKFDLVVFNTLEGSEIIQCAKRVGVDTPMLAFIHNASFMSSKPEYRELLTAFPCKSMVLAPYIAENFAATAQAGFMYPVFFNDRNVPTIAPSAGRRRFCVQGYFDPQRRHYDALLQAMTKLRAEGRKDFEVWVMGRSFAAEFRKFDREVHRLGLEENVRYSWKGIGYASYYRLLNSMDFILPLISPDSHPNYFLSKSTSSIAAAVGFGKIPITHRRLAQLYGIDAACFTYEDDMATVMRSALDADENALNDMRARIQATRTRFLDESERQLAEAIPELENAMKRQSGSSVAMT